jgi:8-hydroxy-5-deazaflavin:NADPH oxidoreductase
VNLVDVAIIGTGNIGSRLARDLVAGGKSVIVAGSNDSAGLALAESLGPLAKAASAAEAIREADAVVLALWLDATKTVIAQYSDLLAGKVIFDPSNPIQSDGKGGFKRTLPDGESSGALIAALLPRGARFVKAFGSVSAEALETWSRREPERAVLFYATDDDKAASVAEQLISAAGFDPVRAGGVDASICIEVFGNLHALGGLNGMALTAGQARALVQKMPATAQ